MKWLQICAVPLTVFFLTGWLGTLYASELRIGVLADNQGPFRSLGNQLRIGAQAAGNQINSAKIIVANLGEFETLEAAYSDLVIDKGVDAVIVGPTQMEMDSLFRAAFEKKIPTILVANSGSLVETNFDYRYILKVGLSEAEVYTQTLGGWAEADHAKRVSILFDADHEGTHQYGDSLTPSVLNSLSRRLKFKEVGYSVSKSPLYADALKELTEYDPEGSGVNC